MTKRKSTISHFIYTIGFSIALTLIVAMFVYNRDSLPKPEQIAGAAVYYAEQESMQFRIDKANQYKRTSMPGENNQNHNAYYRFQLPELPKGDKVSLSLLHRELNGSYYRSIVMVDSSGRLSYRFEKTTGNSRKLLGSKDYRFSRLTVKPGEWYNVKVQVAGSNSTSLKIKAWEGERDEYGGWQYNFTDKSKAISGAGKLAVNTYLYPQVKNVPYIFNLRSVVVTPIDATLVYPSSLSSNPGNPGAPQPTAIGGVPSPTTVSTNPTSVPNVTTRPGSLLCAPPYAINSPWNKKIKNSVSYETTSTYYSSGVLGALRGLTLTSDTSQYAYPVYQVNNNHPLRTVRFRGVFSEVTDANRDGVEDTTVRHRSGQGTTRLRIPNGIQNSRGSDGSLIVINTDTGEEWGFWQVTTESGSQNWKLFTDGSYEVNNGYYYNLSYSAYPPSVDPINDPARPSNERQFLSRGSGLPYYAGLVRPCEIKQGRIDHAVAIAMNRVSSDYVFPATKSDGGLRNGSPAASDLPEGARLQLDPSINLGDPNQLANCKGACRIIARAMQEYGAYVIDYSGRPKIVAEDNYTVNWTSLPAELQVTEKTVSPIPVDKIKLVDFPAPLNTQVKRDQVLTLY